MLKTIVHINSVLNISSTGRIVEEICDVASENSYNSIVFYGRGKYNSIVQSYKVGWKLSIYIHVLLTRLFDLHGLGSILPTLIMTLRLKKLKPNIIHLHNIHGYYINYPILFGF